ncbi:DinB family protein [Pedobacter sp. PWIIR3]
MNEKLTSDLKQYFSSLISLLSGLDEQQINQVPFDDSWTPGQLGDHLLKSYSAIETLKGNVAETSRPIDQHVKMLTEVMLDFSTKMNSPDFILPRTDHIDKADLIRSLQEITDELVAFSANNDLSKTCLDFEMPRIGLLTRLELLSFIDVHTQRHIHQLKEMLPFYH